MPDANDPYEVVYPIKDEKRAAAASRKVALTRIALDNVIGDEKVRTAVLRKTKPEQLIAVFDGNTVIGVLGFTVSGADFTDIGFDDFRAHYGFLPGIGRYLAYNVAKRLYFGPQLYIGAFWVDPNRRGGGFGKRLLAVLHEEALKRNMEMWTDVKAGNEAAFKFYERQGFKPRNKLSISALIPKYLGYQRICFDPNA